MLIRLSIPLTTSPLPKLNHQNLTRGFAGSHPGVEVHSASANTHEGGFDYFWICSNIRRNRCPYHRQLIRTEAWICSREADVRSRMVMISLGCGFD